MVNTYLEQAENSGSNLLELIWELSDMYVCMERLAKCVAQGSRNVNIAIVAFIIILNIFKLSLK